MSGTHLYYNGVLMRDCELIEFAQVIEYDESRTDVLYSRYRITVASTLISLHSVDTSQGIPDNVDADNHIDPQHPSTFAIDQVDGETVVDRYEFIRSKLEQPRKDFWFALNSVSNKQLSENQPDEYTPAADSSQNDPYRVVLAACGIDDFAEVDTEADSDTLGGRKVTGQLSGPLTTNIQIDRADVLDFNNGPKPQSVNIAKIQGGRAMRVHFSIEICRPTCRYYDSELSVHPVRDAERVKGVISNRWSISEGLNENWESEIAIEGTLVVSDHRWKPDAMRTMVSCALFPYAKLASRHFSTSADGLKLKYRYTLKEAGIAPPPGIVDWSGKYTERLQNSGHQTGTMNVKVRGTHTIPDIQDANGLPIGNHQEYKLYMTDWLFILIQSRLDASRQFNPNPDEKGDQLVVLDCVVTENMKEPEVEATVTVVHTSDDLREAFSSRLHNFGKTIYDAQNPLLDDWSERDWPIPPAFTWDTADTSQGSAYDCYFQNPCSEWHSKPRGWNREFEQAKRQEEESAETFAFTSYADSSQVGVGIPASPPDPVLSTYGWSDEQISEGFTFLHVEIDNDYEGDQGNIALPLSKTRTGADSSTGFPETAVFIPVHAGIQTRKFSMVATRQGKWPKVPAPQETISNSSSGIYEKLLSTKVIPEAPKVQRDGRTLEYSVQIQWVYALSRQIGQTGDYYRTGSDPRDKTSIANNEIPVAEFYDYSGSIEGV